jgi:glycosyltransferase involved in cell wall biosynthesis
VKSSLTISVVLTSYNYGRFLPRSIESILDQSRPSDEIIINDDASNDGSQEIIHQYAQKNPIIHFVQNEENEGVISSLNKGLQLAKGRYILFASADDFVFPDLIEKSLAFLEQYPQAAFFTANALIIDEKGNHLGTWYNPVSPSAGFVTPEAALKRMRHCGFWFAGGTTVFRREIFLAVGGFNPAIGHLCDSFVSQVLALRHGYCYLPEPLAAARLSRSSYSFHYKKDIQLSQEVRDQAIKLMRTTFREIFPEDFIEEWEKMWKFLDGIYAWREGILNRQRFFLNETLLKLRPDRRRIDRFFIALLKMASWTQFFLFSIYFMLCFGRGTLFRQYLSPRRVIEWLKRYLKT